MQETKSMQLYIFQRILQAIPLLIGIIIISFILMNMTGDPILAIGGDFPLPEATIQHLRKIYGLDKSIPERLWIYFGKVIRGDLGFSYRQKMPVTTLILSRLGASLSLGAAAIIISSVLGILFGILASLRPRSFFDNIVIFLSISGFSIPVFWLAQIAILLFSAKLGWLPGLGMRTIDFGTDLGFWFLLMDRLKYLILPAFVLATANMAIIARVTRANMLEIMNKDFVTTARAKGLPEYVVKVRHVFRNSLIVVVTMIGLNAGRFIFASVLVETVFAWPGVGRLLYSAITSRDLPVVMGIFIFSTVLVIVINLITDILYSYLDPRIRY